MLDACEQEALDALEALTDVEDRLARLDKDGKTEGAASVSEVILAKRKKQFLEGEVVAKRAKYTHASQSIDSAHASVQALGFDQDTFVSRAPK